MKNLLILSCAVVCGFYAWPASAALRVLACEPEWAALVTELGGDQASVFSATTALQDPHHVEARPSLIARARTADLLVCSGSELEIGWLPLLLTQSGNSRIQAGAPGYFEASKYVVRLEIPSSVDRALGDIHPEGNPHVQTDPRNIATVAQVLAERMAQIDSANADTYRARSKAFLDKWRSAIERWQRRAAPIRGASVVAYHKDLTYLEAWLGLKEVGTLEPKPGIPPTPAHLAQLVTQLQRQPAKAILFNAYQDPQAAQFLSQRTRVPAMMLPFTVGGTDKAKDLFGLFDDTVERLMSAIR